MAMPIASGARKTIENFLPIIGTHRESQRVH
jgi:hypothetical protein